MGTNKKRKLKINCGNNGKGGKGKGGSKSTRRMNFSDETDRNDEPLDNIPSMALSQFPVLDITESPTATGNDSPVNLLNSLDPISNDCQEQVDLGLMDPSLCLTLEDLLFKIDTEDSEISKDFTGHTRRR